MTPSVHCARDALIDGDSGRFELGTGFEEGEQFGVAVSEIRADDGAKFRIGGIHGLGSLLRSQRSTSAGGGDGDEAIAGEAEELVAAGGVGSGEREQDGGAGDETCGGK